MIYLAAYLYIIGGVFIWYLLAVEARYTAMTSNAQPGGAICSGINTHKAIARWLLSEANRAEQGEVE